MDKLEKYRQFVREILSSHAEIANTNDTAISVISYQLSVISYQLSVSVISYQLSVPLQ